MATPTPVRVLVVDDDRLVRRGLRGILAAADGIEVVAEAADGEEAVEVARSVRPDVALVDVRMPRVDGIEATRRLRRLTEPPAVVVLTSFDLDRYVWTAVQAGACGYLLKDAPEERLVAAVRAAVDGVALFDARLTVRLVASFATRASVGDQLLRVLTPRETTLLRELASGESNAGIALRLRISEATVKTHVSHILAKLGAETRVQAVVVAYESGLMDPAGPTPR
ncbi:DNA-binding response regulator, NarL/FixJ family, contains REC and HTH domains [Nocardioides scoriae]|uniref:DNA-binding response regulator, NarL/FixJ family, contains REC and HTH domains n=1 Tax=Nocardioides scoriae TaxID=642780 RepID=A0A1H1LDV9_9ACTN|nr:response regulator transcription factor [Nocardioides scoriae]SDR72597.1 DNA-binding response regulator, NarL/FixJ family, contains REC and HTH domains [Nocardioides scoriae]